MPGVSIRSDRLGVGLAEGLAVAARVERGMVVTMGNNSTRYRVLYTWLLRTGINPAQIPKTLANYYPVVTERKPREKREID